MRLLGTVLGIALLASTAGAAEPGVSPVKRLGKTVVQWKDGHVHLVLSYRWANGVYKKERWLLFETAFMPSGNEPVVVNREDVSLRLPDGTVVPLPSQKKMAEDNADIRRQVEMAAIASEPVVDYFVGALREERLGFFAVPGQAIVFEEVTVNNRSVAFGRLFFRTPGGDWKPGTYTLLVKSKALDVRLPFDLPAGEAKKKGDTTVPW